jgi:type III restriction enzyme
MKLHFEPNLDYQLDAINAVCDVFSGQEICRNEFSLAAASQYRFNFSEHLDGNESGNGNPLVLDDLAILNNVRGVQFRQQLPQSPVLASRDFTVEMETGTGKTYVYLRTLFELNKRFGFSKFVIVVPSVAIKEGVYKTLQITESHFKSLYAGVPFEYYLYDSAKPGLIRNFATSPHVQIMVMTVGAINKKDINTLYKSSEKITIDDCDIPIELVRKTRPVIIVDEPQTVDGGLNGAGKAALDAMHPLCTLRYSATHADKHHMLYRLDAVDAYDRKLVKQIEVAAATVEGMFNRPYVKLLTTENRQGRISARIQADVQTVKGIVRKELSVCDGDELNSDVTHRDLYEGMSIGEIHTGKRACMVLRTPTGEFDLYEGDEHGAVDRQALQRHLIRRTIKEHLDKERKLLPQGIKVLSLFFIDTVGKYRSRLDDGTSVKGEYALIFEEEYARLIKQSSYQDLQPYHAGLTADRLHEGYFSIDKKGGWSDTRENNAGNRENAERAYNLIMRDKETLLSMKTPLRFIFSHSALKEGWDNPNVFQICNLREMGSERERRQTLGRGLRLCVNQLGERIHGFEVNTLTVIATESYEQFAKNLQKEMEEDAGVRFGVIEKHSFAALIRHDSEGLPKAFGDVLSAQLWDDLHRNNYLTVEGRATEALRKALPANDVLLPSFARTERRAITEILKKCTGRIIIKNADERRVVLARRAILHGEEFRALWERIKHHTTYRVHFDSENLLACCISALNKAPEIEKPRLQWRKATMAINKSGIDIAQEGITATANLRDERIDLPDVLSALQDKTQLTRRTLCRILTGCERLDDFRTNPQQFIERAASLINHCKRLALVDGIKYQRLGQEFYYAQSLFEEHELSGYLVNILAETHKCIYEQVVCDSNVEREFADALEKNEAIRVYAKLPGWFTVPTPLGKYNPDWAVLLQEEDGSERVYFVVETKGGVNTEALRRIEAGKITCGKAHFKSLAQGGEDETRYIVAESVERMFDTLEVQG